MFAMGAVCNINVPVATRDNVVGEVCDNLGDSIPLEWTRCTSKCKTKGDEGLYFG